MKTETYTSTRQWFYKILNTHQPSGWWRGLFFVLYLLSLIYLFAVQLRIFLYRSKIFRVYRLPKRVISVGNISAGGTGKTPIVLSLARFFMENNIQVAILSRGYKREKPDRIVVVSDGKQVLVSPSQAGEEAYFLAKELNGVIVAVGKNRYRTALYLLQRYRIDLFILDDGFQHLKLHRDTNILLLDNENPLGNGYVLPRGLLREPSSSIKRASLVLFTRKGFDVTEKGQFSNRICSDMIPSYSICFVPGSFKNMLTSEHYSPESLNGKTTLLFSGIGNPKSFRDLIEECRIQVVRELIFPDHHLYQPADMDAIYDIARSRKVDFIITTDKDAVKLNTYLRKEIPILILKLELKVENDFPWKDIKEGRL